MKVAVNALIFDDLERVLLTLRQDLPVWCLPGGLVEAHETVSEAMRREVLEEIGVVVEVLRLVGVYSEGNIRLIPPAKEPTIAIGFVCRIENGVPTTSEEVARVDYFDVGGLPSNVIETHPRRVWDALGARVGLFD